MRCTFPIVALLLTLASPLFAADATTQPNTGGRTTLNFDNDWRFFKGEPPLQPTKTPAGAAYALTDPPSHAFSDQSWRKLNLPHDWSIEGPFDEKAPTLGAGAFAPSGIAWYRKSFTLPETAKGKKVFFEFDGVMANADVYLNKSLLGHHPNGYTPFRFDITHYLDAKGGPNIVAVRTDTTRQPASRWYTGAGIYRHSRLVIQNPIHIEHGSTFITTPEVTADKAKIIIRTRVRNDSDKPVFEDDLSFSAAFQRPSSPTENKAAVAGKTTHMSATSHGPGQAIPPNGFKDCEFEFTAEKPLLWDIATPHLYMAEVEVRSKDVTLDSESTPFGIRTAEFKPDTGFHLNGKNIKLKGVCLHHDAGALGAAVPYSAWETRLAALKKLGVNAIRSAHNPASAELLEAADHLGLLVMDEAFDVWSVAKEPADGHLFFKDWWQRDVTAMITRDRNHPSVIIYSLGNEIWDLLPQNPDPAADQFIGPVRTIEQAKATFLPMRDLVHQLDPTRPVTLACMRPNVMGIYDNGFADLEDVIGQNYRDAELAAAHKAKPTRKIIGTENYHDRATWLLLRDNPALSGQFLWTGVDYLGESRAWPTLGSGSGLLDRTNHPKGNALERASWWSETPVLFIARAQPAGGAGRGNPQTAPAAGRGGAGRGAPAFRDWSPANANPHDETINIYSNCDEVELFLNDKSLGSKPLNADASPRTWTVPFAPGTLKAQGKNKSAPDRIVASDTLRTAGPPTGIALSVDRKYLLGGSDNVAYVRATIIDDNGTPVPRADHLIRFSLTGPADIIAVDSGDQRSHEPFNATERKAYQGTCVAIIRPTNESAQVIVKATADDLAEASTSLEVGDKAEH